MRPATSIALLLALSACSFAAKADDEQDGPPPGNPRAAGPTISATIPADFVGEWQTDLKDCGTWRNDTWLRIEPRTAHFYASDVEVRQVTIHDVRSVTVDGVFEGEGEVSNDSFTMALSRSGSDLTIDGFTRHRCPATQ